MRFILARSMCAKFPIEEDFNVRSPQALIELERWLATFPPSIRQRGNQYHRSGQVTSLGTATDHFVDATVQGGELYTVTLFLTRGKWSSKCSCPVGSNCKHVVAAGLAWLESDGSDYGDEEDFDEDEVDVTFPPPYVRPFQSLAKPAPAQPSRGSFRAHWTPILAEKLGRPLTDAEGRMLGQLSALFTEASQSYAGLNSEALRRHGFADALPRNAPAWGPLFQEWFNFHENPPVDPWALWQYLAYSLELQGKPIPEVLRPLTNTAVVHAAIDARLSRRQLDAWRTALADPAAAAKSEARTLAQEGVAAVRTRFSTDGKLFVEIRAALNKPWKTPTNRACSAIANALPADLEPLPPAEAALVLVFALTLRNDPAGYRLKQELSAELIGLILNAPAARNAVVMPDERPLTIEPEPLIPEAIVSPTIRDRLEVRLILPDGTEAKGARPITTAPEPLYWHEGRIWRGPPPLPTTPLPYAALSDSALIARFRSVGLRLPANLEVKRRVVKLRPTLRLWLVEPPEAYETVLRVQLLARAADPACEQEWRGRGGWLWTEGKAPPPRKADDPILEIDLQAAEAVGARFGDLRLYWDDFEKTWARPLSKSFPEEFAAWRETLAPDVVIEAAPELAGFFGEPLRAKLDVSAIAADSSHDWFDLTVALRVADTTLSADEIALLLKARGKWVRLAKLGWRRLEVEGGGAGDPSTEALDRLGLTAEDVWASGKPSVHRLHALQLASEANALESRDAALAGALRDRVAALKASAPPALPKGLVATLRPYQQEGFQFLAHLAQNGFGGVLADDMGLGKTVQALAWLLHLAGPTRGGAKKFRALVVCPKSVTHGWLAETKRFAPSLSVMAFTPDLAEKPAAKLKTAIVVANYTQLRLNAEWFHGHDWDVAILDEGQFIKNPSSQIAEAARNLRTKHRLVLTGTPVENRLTDLWSLFAFAQPGLLGTQTAFRRQYDEKDPAALARVHRRVRHFLLRRTKAQAAPDLPPRTEDDLFVELEPEQRKLYDAELKRARQQLLGIETDRALDKMRFNVLASLLRLRQICCHPALVDPAHAALPSAKLDALLERLDELREEGHQVLVFSQFVEMLELIRQRLEAAKIGHLILTGATENRGELMEEFQRDRTKTVFLLSLKAAGFGLNLTAASYAVLFDPWWNPAVEAQAIDRTHRIGQTRPVIAYRFLARDTVEEKIRALQQEKAALAAAVVQEESLASVLDLESLKKILG